MCEIISNKTTYVKRAAEREGFPSSAQEGDSISVFVLTQSEETTTASSSVLYRCSVGTLCRAAGESVVIVWTWDGDTDLMIFRLLFLTRGLHCSPEEMYNKDRNRDLL